MDFHTLGRKDLQALCKKNQIRANLTNTAMADALQALATVQGLDELQSSPTQVKAQAAGTHAYPTRSHSTRKQNKRMKIAQEEEEHQGVDEVVSLAEVSGEQFHYSLETGGLVDLSTSDLLLCSKNLITVEEIMQSEPVTTNELNLDPTSDKVSGAATFKLQPCSLGTEIAKNEDEEFELQSPDIRAEVNEQIEELQSSAEGTSETMDMDTDRLVLSSELLIKGSAELSSGQREEVPSADAEIFEEKTPSEPVTRSSHPTELNLDCTPDKESAAAIFKLQHCSQGAKSTKTGDEEFKVRSPEIRTGWDEPIVKLSEMVDEQSMQNAVEGRSEAMDLDTDRSVSLSEIMIEGTGEPLIKQISRGVVITVDVEFSEEEARQLEPVTTTSSHLIAIKTDLTSDKGSSAIFKLQHCNQGTENQKIECEESDLQSLESRTGYDEPKEKLSDMEQEQGMQGVVGGRSEAMEFDTDRPVLPSEILIEGSGDFHTLCWKDLQALCKKNQIRANMTITAMADALQALPTVQGLDEFHNLHSRTQVKAEASGTHVHSTRSQSTRKHHKRMKATQEEEEHKGVDEVVSSAEVLGERFHYSPETGGLVDLSTSDLVLCSKNLIKMEEMTQSEPVTTNERNLDPTSDNLSGAATFKLQPCSLGTEIAKTEDEEFELQSPEIRTEVNEQIEELQSSVEGASETMDMDTDRLVLPSELLIEGSGKLSSGQREEVPSADAEIFEERTPEPVTRSSYLTELNLDPTPDKESAAAIFKLQHCSQGAKILKTEDEEFKLQSPEIKTGWDEPIVKLSEMVDEQSMQNAAEGRSEAMDLDTDRVVSLSEIMIEETGEPSMRHISRGEVISVDVEFSEEEARQLESVTTTSSHLIAIKTDLTSDKGSSAIFKLQHCNQGTENQKIECEESDLRSLESRTGYDEPKEKLSDMEQEQGMQSAVGGRSEAMELDTDRPVLPSEILIEGSGDFHTLCRKDLQALCKKNQIRANMTITAMADALQAHPTVQGLDEFHKGHSPTQVKAEASGPLVYSTRSQSTRKQHKRMKTTQEEEEHTGVDEVVPSGEVSGEQFHHTPETGGLVDLSTSALVLCPKNLTTMEETTQSEPVTAIELNLDPTPDEVNGAATFILQHCSRGTESDETEDRELKLPSPEISTEGNEQREELQSAVRVTSEATDMDTDLPVPPSELLIEGSGELFCSDVPSVDANIFVEERTPSEPVTRSGHVIELKLNPTPDKGCPAPIFKLQHYSRATESMKTGEEEFKLQSPEIRTECDEPTEKPSELVGEQSMQNAVGGRSEAMDLDTDIPVPLSGIMIEGTDEHSIKRISREKVIPVDTDLFKGEMGQLEPVTTSGDDTPVQSKDWKIGDELKGQNQRSGDDSTEKLHSLSLRKLKLLYKESREAKGLIKKERGCGGQELRAESKEDGVKKTDLNYLSLRKLKQKLKEKLTQHDKS